MFINVLQYESKCNDEQNCINVGKLINAVQFGDEREKLQFIATTCL